MSYRIKSILLYDWTNNINDNEATLGLIFTLEGGSIS